MNAVVTETEERRVTVTKGDYANKTGKVVGEVQKGYWKGIRVQLDSGREIDVLPTSVTARIEFRMRKADFRSLRKAA